MKTNGSAISRCLITCCACWKVAGRVVKAVQALFDPNKMKSTPGREAARKASIHWEPQSVPENPYLGAAQGVR